MCAREFAIGIHPQFYWEEQGQCIESCVGAMCCECDLLTQIRGVAVSGTPPTRHGRFRRMGPLGAGVAVSGGARQPGGRFQVGGPQNRFCGPRDHSIHQLSAGESQMQPKVSELLTIDLHGTFTAVRSDLDLI